MTLPTETVVDEGTATPEAQTDNPQAAEQTTQDTTQAPPQEDTQDRNWRAMRQSQEQLQETNRLLMAQLEAQKATQSPKEPVRGSDWENVDGSDLLTKDQALTAAEKIAARAVEKALRQRDYEEAPNLIENQHKDYNLVVTDENIARLKKANPRLAASLKDIKDPYAQGALCYSYIKSCGIYKEEGDAKNRQKAVDNSKKPLPMTAVKPTAPLDNANAYANGLTPDLKKSLWLEMQSAIRKG